MCQPKALLQAFTLNDGRAVPAVVRGGGSVLRDGQRRPGSHQVVTGIMREAAGLAQRAGGAHTNRDQERERITSSAL